MKFRVFLLAVLGFASTAFCQEKAASEELSSPPRPTVRPDAANYLLQPSDLISVTVFQEPDLERQLRVAQDYSITLPLIGQVSVRDKTIQNLEAEIRDHYNRDFLVNPQVNVNVIEYAIRTVNVQGSVNAPGLIPLPPEDPLRLIDAIARAGGFTRLANMNRIQLTRKAQDGTSQTFTINVDDILRGRSTEAWFLQRDDVINVPERIL
jgi:polysaccharide biosynthesis/export protein